MLKLRNHGYTAYFCGGCVRDLFLQRCPKDYDIATDAQPRQIQQLFKHTIMVGAKFGVVKVLDKQECFEIATFRKDKNYSDGRRPDAVRFCNEKEDARRRDFTVNGLFLDPVSNQVIDYVGGLADLQQKIIRTIGNPQSRFSEDYLRLMRAVRFASQLDFTIEPATWNAIKSMASLITRVSAERIRDELITMLTGKNSAKALRLLDQSGILMLILPEWRVANHPEILQRTLSLLEIGTPISDGELALSTVFINIKDACQLAPERFEAIGKRFCLANKSIRKISSLLSGIDRFAEVPAMTIAEFKRFLRLPNFKSLLELYRWRCLARGQDQRIYAHCRDKLQNYASEELKPAPVINGNDLIELGIKPGPLFQEILHFIEDQQLEGNVHNRQQALALVKTEFMV